MRPVVLLLLSRLAAGQPVGTPVELGLAGYAKVLCSAVFVSMRDPAEAFHNSGYWMMPNDQQDGVTYIVDREEKLVRMTRGAITRTAKFYGDQGCIIDAHDGAPIHFTPVRVTTRLPDAASQPWPMGDRTSKETTDIDQARLAKAVDLAFSDPAGLTASFLVVYKGQIVAERYMPALQRIRSSKAGPWERA